MCTLVCTITVTSKTSVTARGCCLLFREWLERICGGGGGERGLTEHTQGLAGNARDLGEEEQVRHPCWVKTANSLNVRKETAVLK